MTEFDKMLKKCSGIEINIGFVSSDMVFIYNRPNKGRER